MVENKYLVTYKQARSLASSPVAIEGEHFPSEVGYDAKLQSGKEPFSVVQTPTVSSAVRVAHLRPSRRLRIQMWRSWAGVDGL
jgi:hypothetical protein